MSPIRIVDGQQVKAVGFDSGGLYLGALTDAGSLSRFDLAAEARVVFICS